MSDTSIWYFVKYRGWRYLGTFEVVYDGVTDRWGVDFSKPVHHEGADYPELDYTITALGRAAVEGEDG